MANDLWESALDTAGIAASQRRALEYILKEMKCTKPAQEFLEKQLAGDTPTIPDEERVQPQKADVIDLEQ